MPTCSAPGLTLPLPLRLLRLLRLLPLFLLSLLPWLPLLLLLLFLLRPPPPLWVHARASAVSPRRTEILGGAALGSCARLLQAIGRAAGAGGGEAAARDRGEVGTEPCPCSQPGILDEPAGDGSDEA